MPIKDSHGNTFLLKGPNKLMRNKGKFWDLSSIKYVNFDDYGKPFNIQFTKVSMDNIEKERPQASEEPKEVFNIDEHPVKIIDNSFGQDDYLEEENEPGEFQAPVSQEISSIEVLDNKDEKTKPGSPVLYYSSKTNQEHEEKIYAQVHHASDHSCIFEFDISQWHDKIIQNPEENDLIYCEWDSTWWKIISIIKMGDVAFRIITEKYQK